MPYSPGISAMGARSASLAARTAWMAAAEAESSGLRGAGVEEGGGGACRGEEEEEEEGGGGRVRDVDMDVDAPAPRSRSR